MTEHFVPTSAVPFVWNQFQREWMFCLLKVKGFGKKTFVFQGCKLWNDLPTNIKSIARNHSFKVAVKAHFLNML